jgi:hypothetical protein
LGKLNFFVEQTLFVFAKFDLEKLSKFWQNFQTLESSTAFSTCVSIKNSEEKSAKV